jgi:hypothetical protein
MELLALAKEGTPFLLLGLLVAVIVLEERVRAIAKHVENIRFIDTCDERHKALDCRVEKLEAATGLDGA